MPFSQRLGLGSFGRAVPGQKPDPAWWVSLNKLILYSLETSQFQLQGYGTFFDPQPPACVPAMTAGQDLRELSFLRLTELDLSGIFILQCGGACVRVIALLDGLWSRARAPATTGVPACELGTMRSRPLTIPHAPGGCAQGSRLR